MGESVSPSLRLYAFFSAFFREAMTKLKIRSTDIVTAVYAIGRIHRIIDEFTIRPCRS